jgi:hypothetical protein
MQDGEMAILSPEGVQIKDFQGNPRPFSPEEISWSSEMAERGGYPHFMLKEICEQPDSVQNTLRGHLPEDEGTARVEAEDRRRIELIAAGEAGGFWGLVQESGDRLRWCGASPLYAFLHAVRPPGGELLRYEQWNIDEASVVSFAGLVFPAVATPPGLRYPGRSGPSWPGEERDHDHADRQDPGAAGPRRIRRRGRGPGGRP